MLEIRPNCEHCNKKLPPNSNEAMICSFECTFCKSCVANVLKHICPNCGGNFSKRPIRPLKNRNCGNYLGKYPASKKIKHNPVNTEQHKKFLNELKKIRPQDR